MVEAQAQAQAQTQAQAQARLGRSHCAGAGAGVGRYYALLRGRATVDRKAVGGDGLGASSNDGSNSRSFCSTRPRPRLYVRHSP